MLSLGEVVAQVDFNVLCKTLSALNRPHIAWCTIRSLNNGWFTAARLQEPENTCNFCHAGRYDLRHLMQCERFTKHVCDAMQCGMGNILKVDSELAARRFAVFCTVAHALYHETRALHIPRLRMLPNGTSTISVISDIVSGALASHSIRY